MRRRLTEERKDQGYWDDEEKFASLAANSSKDKTFTLRLENLFPKDSLRVLKVISNEEFIDYLQLELNKYYSLNK